MNGKCARNNLYFMKIDEKNERNRENMKANLLS